MSDAELQDIIAKVLQGRNYAEKWVQQDARAVLRALEQHGYEIRKRPKKRKVAA